MSVFLPLSAVWSQKACKVARARKQPPFIQVGLADNEDVFGARAIFEAALSCFFGYECGHATEVHRAPGTKEPRLNCMVVFGRVGV